MGFLDYIKESFSAGIREFMKEIEKEFSRTVLRRIDIYRRKIMRDLIAAFVILISIGLLAISAVFFFIEYLNLSKTLSFLVIGIIVLIIGILIKISS